MLPLDKLKETKLNVNKKREGKSVAFTKPTLDEIAEYCSERKNKIDPEKFFAHYESNGWMVGKNHMKDWKMTVVSWEKRDFESGNNAANNAVKKGQNDDVSEFKRSSGFRNQ